MSARLKQSVHGQPRQKKRPSRTQWKTCHCDSGDEISHSCGSGKSSPSQVPWMGFFHEKHHEDSYPRFSAHYPGIISWFQPRSNCALPPSSLRRIESSHGNNWDHSKRRRHRSRLWISLDGGFFQTWHLPKHPLRCTLLQIISPISSNFFEVKLANVNGFSGHDLCPGTSGR